MLGQYLLDAGRRSFAWGQHDCCTFPADWALLRLGQDPMVHLRGTYSTEEEARAIVEEAGDLVALWSDVLSGLDISEASDPREGDVGVITVLGEAGPIANGSIFTGRRWAFLAPRGLFVSSIGPAEILKVWRLG